MVDSTPVKNIKVEDYLKKDVGNESESRNGTSGATHDSENSEAKRLEEADK